MHKKRLQRLTAVVLAVIMMLSLAAVAGAENTEDIVREADVSVRCGKKPATRDIPIRRIRRSL